MLPTTNGLSSARSLGTAFLRRLFLLPGVAGVDENDRRLDTAVPHERLPVGIVAASHCHDPIRESLMASRRRGIRLDVFQTEAREAVRVAIVAFGRRRGKRRADAVPASCGPGIRRTTH